jgi:putative Mn2+ efflux pump MntP
MLGIFFLLVALVLFFVTTLLGHYVSPYVQLGANIVIGLPLVLLSVFCVREGMRNARIVRTVQRRRRAFAEFAREQKLEPTAEHRARFNLEWDMKHLGTNAEDALKELNENPLLKDAG